MGPRVRPASRPRVRCRVPFAKLATAPPSVMGTTMSIVSNPASMPNDSPNIPTAHGADHCTPPVTHPPLLPPPAPLSPLAPPLLLPPPPLPPLLSTLLLLVFSPSFTTRRPDPTWSPAPKATLATVRNSKPLASRIRPACTEWSSTMAASKPPMRLLMLWAALRISPPRVNATGLLKYLLTPSFPPQMLFSRFALLCWATSSRCSPVSCAAHATHAR
mmetsp:Transcript_88844/g.177664  ORF Transcript_88844/g.177664 Transcript_88844/m.177664 type:complete len:217 (-) Transcript_88844:508-1158(-)